MPHQVFISYATPDKKIADALCHALEQSGIRCWIAPRDIPGGKDYSEGIIDGIGDCQVLVVVFSSHANESRFVKNEIERAFSRGIPILPVRVEDVLPGKSLELFLGATHWLDAFQPPVEDHFTAVIETAGNLIGLAPTLGKPSARKLKRRLKAAGISFALIAALGVVGWMVVRATGPGAMLRSVMMSETDRQFLKSVATDIATQLGRINLEVAEIRETQRQAREFVIVNRASAKIPEPNELSLWLEHRLGQLDKLKAVSLWMPDWTTRLDNLGISGNDAHSLYTGWLPQYWIEVRDFYTNTRQFAVMPPMGWLKEQDRITELKGEFLIRQAEAIYYGALALLSHFPTATLEDFHKLRPQYTQLPSVGTLTDDEAEKQMEASLNRMEEAKNALTALVGEENIGVQVLEKKLATVLHMQGRADELQKELEAAEERIREKCRLLPEDPPGIMWGKILRLHSAGLMDDVQKGLQHYLELNRVRDIYASNYVASAKAYFGNEAAYPEGLGVLVIGFENDRQHSAIRVGDILLEKNGIKLPRSEDLLKAPKTPDRQANQFDLLRLKPDGTFQRMALTSEVKKNPRIAVADLREASGDKLGQ